jgi:hypothetical protein
MNYSWKKTIAAFLILTLAIVIMPMSVGAKKKAKAKTKAKAATKLHNLRYTTNRARVDAKATPVGLGKHKFKVRKTGCGYIKFTAPRDAKYTITVSGLKRNKKRQLPGKHYWFRVLTVHPVNQNALVLNKVKTNGGKTRNLYFWRKTIAKGSKVLRYRKSRYAKIRLKAGETVYVFFCCNNKDSFKVKINKTKTKKSQGKKDQDKIRSRLNKSKTR